MSSQFSTELLSTERTQHAPRCEYDNYRYFIKALLREERLREVSKMPPYADREGRLATLRIRDQLKLNRWLKR